MKNYITVFALSLITSLNTFASTFYDHIYLENAYSLYDLSEVINSNNYQNAATVIEQENLLEEAFLKNKERAYCQVQNIDLLLLSPLISFLATKSFLSRTSTNTAMKATAGHQASSSSFQTNYFLSNLLTTLWGAFIYPIAYYFSKETTQTVAGHINSIRQCWMGPYENELHKLEIKYVRNKPNWSEKWQKAIERKLIQARSSFHMRSQYIQENNDPTPELTFVKLALALPTKNLPMESSLHELSQKLEQYQHMASTNEQSAFEQMIYFCESIVQSSLQQNPNLKSALYLYGSPGTGKTEAIKIMADVLKIPLIKINLSEVETVSDLKGLAPHNNDNLPQGKPGLIASQLIDLNNQGINTNRVIIFFDEADRVLNRVKDGEINDIAMFMLELLENRTKSFENPYFKADIDIQNISFVLAGNSRLKAVALDDRVDTAYFGGYSLEYRKKTGQERFLNEAITDYSNILNRDDFTQNDLDHIAQIAVLEHNKITKGNEIETEPGFREQQRKIKQFVHRKAMQKSKSLK